MKRLILLLIAMFLMFSGCGSPPAKINTPIPTQSPVPTQVTPTPIVYSNPLTGLQTDKDILKNRPFAIMINDLKEALPQCGVSSADIIYEASAEGGITRMLAVYQDISKAGKIGSIRSTRTYFLDLAQGMDAILIHAGASVYAYDALKARSISHVDGIYNSTLFYRDENRMSFGYEHSLFSDSALIQENIADSVDRLQHKAGYRYNMKFGISSAKSGVTANRLEVPFSGYKTGVFSFNQEDGLYYISQFNNPYTDGNTNKQVAVKNVLVLYANHSAITNDPLKNIEVDLTGSGTGLYACDGKYIEITWFKESSDSQFVYKLKNGEEMIFSPGKTYINIIALDRKVEIS